MRREVLAKFTITQYQTKDTLYLTDVQGQSFSNGNDIYYFTDPDDATTRTTASVIVGSSGFLQKLMTYMMEVSSVSNNIIMHIMVAIIKFKLLILNLIPQKLNLLQDLI